MTIDCEIHKLKKNRRSVKKELKLYPHTPSLPGTPYTLEKFIYNHFLIIVQNLLITFYELLFHMIYCKIL